MAKKRPVQDREALKVKFQVLQEYISHHERKLDQFGIDLRNAALDKIAYPSDEFVDRVWKALSDLYAADPPTSLIDADLAGARAEVNSAYNSSPEWAEFKEKVIKAGLGEASVEAGFDSVLGYATMHVLGRLRAMRLSTDPIDGLEGGLFEIMESARMVLLDALVPAKQLRQRWLDELNGQPGAGSPARQKRGGSCNQFGGWPFSAAWESGLLAFWPVDLHLLWRRPLGLPDR